MRKINIIIAKRGRDKYLKPLRHSLDHADNVANYDVTVYMRENMEKNINKKFRFVFNCSLAIE